MRVEGFETKSLRQVMSKNKEGKDQKVFLFLESEQSGTERGDVHLTRIRDDASDEPRRQCLSPIRGRDQPEGE